VAPATPEQDDERLELIGELQSLSAALRAPETAGQPPGDIPVLLDVVELPEQAPRASSPEPLVAAPVHDTGTALQIEAASIVDDLIDEFLPLVEARMRELVEQRLQPLLDEANRGHPPD